jgi:hypothetical protein
MAVSAVITPGKIFNDGEAVTVSELNKLGAPTVDISGAVGSLSLADGSVTNAKVAAGTGVQLNKLETGTDAQVIVANSSGEGVWVAVSGDATVDNLGALTIADDAVTPAKLEDGTQGDILYYGASGAPARLGTGTSGQVLKSGGAGANPAWASGAGTMLGHSYYDPASQATISPGTSYADLDTTNVAVTFTAPTSGNVLLKAHYTLNLQGDATTGLFLSLHDGASTITDSGRTVARPSITGASSETGEYAMSSCWKLTGLSGAKTLTVQGKIYSTGYVDVLVGGDYGPFVIEVIEL